MILDSVNKKEYTSPSADVEYFTIDDIITTSGGQGRFDDEDGIDAISEPDAVVVDTETGEVKAFLDEFANEFTQEDLDSIY